MTKYLAAVALAFAVASVEPASAVTFPSLTTIYVGSGVQDGAGTGATTGVAVSCTNVSGVAANLRVVFLNFSSAIAAQTTVTIVHGESRTFSTRALNSIFSTIVPTGQITSGVVNIESTQSGMLCSAMLLDSTPVGPHGVALHLVRINPHPGTVE